MLLFDEHLKSEYYDPYMQISAYIESYTPNLIFLTCVRMPKYVVDFSFSVDCLFTQKIAEFYENYYTSKGVTFIKGTTVSSLEISSGKVSFRSAVP